MKPRLTCQDRREIAVKSQVLKMSVRRIAAEGFQKSAIQRWKDVPYLSPDSDFADRPLKKKLVHVGKLIKLADNYFL